MSTYTVVHQGGNPNGGPNSYPPGQGYPYPSPGPSAPQTINAGCRKKLFQLGDLVISLRAVIVLGVSIAFFFGNLKKPALIDKSGCSCHRPIQYFI